MFTKLKDKTKLFRQKTSFTVMKLLTPTVYNTVQTVMAEVHNPKRPFDDLLKKEYGNNSLVGCEIGFGYGQHAEHLLQTLNLKKLYCIDPYINQPYLQEGRQIETYLKNDQSRYSRLKDQYGNKVKFISASSIKAIDLIENNSLDFVYIDGDHSYDYVFCDLSLYYHKVKAGGYLGGHDYIFGQPNLICAVQDYALLIHKAPIISFPDYWFLKEVPLNYEVREAQFQ